MKNVFFRAVILAFVLVFGMTVISCDDGSGGGGTGGGGDDDWVNVTSLAQINGTWKYAGSQTEYTLGEGITYKSETEIIYIINASARTITFSQNQKITLSGFSTSDWTYYTSYITEETQTITDTDDDGIPYTYTITVEINNTNRTITQTYTSTQTLTLTNEEIAQISSSGMQISKDGTKLKFPVDEDDDNEPMIFYKQ